jgi:hypothetical protein
MATTTKYDPNPASVDPVARKKARTASASPSKAGSLAPDTDVVTIQAAVSTKTASPAIPVIRVN